VATKRTGLGRGIGALIPVSEEGADRPVDVFFPTGQQTADELVAVPGARLANLNPLDVVPNAQQPRAEFREEELAELVTSIREVGVLQPIVVRPLPRDASAKGTTAAPQYELVMGERRLRATKQLGLATIPAIVKETADESMLRDALLENLHRAELNPLEEASAYQQLLADFGITQDELSSRIGRSRPQISNTLRLLRLPASVQRRVASGVLSAGHARAILSTGDSLLMERLADKIVNEDLSVRAAEAAAAGTSIKPRTTRSAVGRHQAHLDEVAENLGDKLETKVKVRMGARKGSIAIDFASMQDLNRILAALGQDPFSQ
jgi:ParB family chromosome partitioning protein